MEARLIVADYSSPGSSDVPNPCVIGSAHLFLGSVFVMSEGRRGSDAGRVESRLAVSEVLTRFRSGATSEPQQRLCDALNHAGKVLYSRSQAARIFSESSATCSAVLIRGDRLYASRVGNMGLIVLRQERPIVLLDHRSHPPSNVVGLGQSQDVSPDVVADPVPLMVGDRILLANATLLNAVAEDEWIRVVSGLVPAVATRRLVEAVVRAGEMRPVSVQIIEVEEFTEARDEVLPALGTRSSAGGSAKAQGLREPYRGASGGILIPKERSGWVAKALLVLVAALVLAMVTRFIWPKWDLFSEPDVPSSAVESSETTADGHTSEESPKGEVETPESQSPDVPFWQHLSTKLDAGALPTDAETLRELINDPDDLQKRLSEAQALAAALQTLVDEEKQRPIPKESATDDVSNSAPADVPVAKKIRWDPERLPKNLRAFDQIFSHPDPKEAALRFRRHIASRHRVAPRLLRLMDVYIRQAPKERSLRVIEHLSEQRPRPGPRTRRWAWRAKRMLRKAINEEKLDSTQSE